VPGTSVRQGVEVHGVAGLAWALPGTVPERSRGGGRCRGL